jgi:hypothetical protein
VDIPKHLKDLLPILAAYRVASFEFDGLKLTFHVEQVSTLATKDHTIEIPADESMLPPDLRTDNITSADTILHWSGSPDFGEESQLPLTGDAPLDNL